MTVIVGILCKDGVVIGADSSCTLGSSELQKTVEQPTQKIEIIGDRIIVAGTGQVGLGQRFCSIVERLWNSKFLIPPQQDPQNPKLSPPPHHIFFAETICHHARGNFGHTQVHHGAYGALVAFSTQCKPFLCEFVLVDLQPEFKDEKIWYAS